MDTATQFASHLDPRTRSLLVLCAAVLAAAILLAFAGSWAGAASDGPMRDDVRLAPFRWTPPASVA